MKEIIISKEVEDEKVESFLQSLPFIPEPTFGMISALAVLLHSSEVRESLLLGISSLVHTMCTKITECETVPEIQALMKTLEKFLGVDCRTTEPTDIRKVQLALKAIGNAGQAAASLTATLSNCASSQTNPSEIRLAAIEAFRRIPCSADRSVLIQLYQTMDDSSDIRIASYYTAMRCPSDGLFDIIRQILQNETSTQVNAFVWSHLSQIMETSDPAKQQLRNSLPDDIISKDFDMEVWKYSSYRDATFHAGIVLIYTFHAGIESLDKDDTQDKQPKSSKTSSGSLPKKSSSTTKVKDKSSTLAPQILLMVVFVGRSRSPVLEPESPTLKSPILQSVASSVASSRFSRLSDMDVDHVVQRLLQTPALAKLLSGSTLGALEPTRTQPATSVPPLI
ncbi:vitellogenin-like [Protopterus annectens]|uniref:vitellogenin-like n=1 Tax=Protopterus annectens TaxID=7888 RepID=UPI001CF9F151|nr:vitellogenin-like [Protopterus annectens]